MVWTCYGLGCDRIHDAEDRLVMRNKLVSDVLELLLKPTLATMASASIMIMMIRMKLMMKPTLATMASASMLATKS